MLTLENLTQVNSSFRFRYLPDSPAEYEHFMIFGGEAVTIMSFAVPKHGRLSGRRTERVATSLPAVLVVDSEKGRTSRPANAIDTSRDGVRIQINGFYLTPGQTVEVVLTGDDRRSAQGRVVWVRPSPSDLTIQLGLEILDPRPSSR